MNSAFRNEDIVDTILRIMNEDDRPQTKMILKKNAHKRHNGADRFNADHQKAYEDWSKQNGDWVATIKQHNNACPKLYDVLDRRKSLTTVTTAATTAKQSRPRASTAKDAQKYNPNCVACTNLMKLNELNKLKVKPKCLVGRRPRAKPNRRKSRHRRHPRRSHKEYPRSNSHHDKKQKEKNSRDRLTGIVKPKSRMCQNTNTKITQLLKMKLSETQSSAPHSVYHNSKPPSISNPCEEKNSSNQSLSEPIVDALETKDASDTKNTSKSSQMSGKSSITSYHSFMSMEHEPMVTS